MIDKYNVGYTVGYETAKDKYFSEGYDKGYYAGLNSGMEAGGSKGYADGYDDGYIEALKYSKKMLLNNFEAYPAPLERERIVSIITFLIDVEILKSNAIQTKKKDI